MRGESSAENQICFHLPFPLQGREPRPVPAAPGWDSPTRPSRRGAALRPGLGGCQGIPPRHTQPVNVTLEPAHGAVCPPGSAKAGHGPAPLPHSMRVAAGLRPPSSSRQWWRIADHTQSPTCPCSAPSLSPTLLSPPQSPGEQPRDNPRTNRPHPWAAVPSTGHTYPPPISGEMRVMGMP